MAIPDFESKVLKKIPPTSAVQWHWQRARWHKNVLQQIKTEHGIQLFDWLIVNSPSKHLKMVKNLSCGFRMTVILLMSAKSAVVCPPVSVSVSENVSLFLSVCVFIYLLPAREKWVCKLSSDNKNTLLMLTSFCHKKSLLKFKGYSHFTPKGTSFCPTLPFFFLFMTVTCQSPTQLSEHISVSPSGRLCRSLC